MIQAAASHLGRLPSQRGFSQSKVWNLERMTNRCRLRPQSPLPVSLLAATDQQGWPPLDALLVTSSLDCINSQVFRKQSQPSLRTPASLSLKVAGRWDEGKTWINLPCAAPSTRSHSPALWFWPDRTPLTCSCPEGRLNRRSSLQTKLWTFSSLCVGCLWRSKCLQHDIAYYRVFWTVFDNWTLTGPFTFRLHSNSIIQAVLPGPSQSCHPLCRPRLSPNTFVCLTCSEVKQIQMSRVWSRGSLQGHARRQVAHASKTLNSSKGFCKTLLKAKWERDVVSCCKLLGIGILCSYNCPCR